MQTPTLEGTHVRLEPLSLNHLPALEAVVFDPSIWRYMLSTINTPDDLRAWLNAALTSTSNLAWVTINKATNQLVGSTRFIDLDLTHRTTELGHTWLTASARGTHIHTEAKLLQLTYAFETLNLNRAAFKTHHENLQSQAAMRAIGCIYEGTFRNHYIMPDGSLRHSVWFSIIREDWPTTKALLESRLASRSYTPISTNP